MAEGEPRSFGLLLRVISVEDAEEALVLLPEGFEGDERIDARQS